MNKKLNASLSREQMKNIMGGTIKMKDELPLCPTCWTPNGPQSKDCIWTACDPLGPIQPTNPNALP
ncbi:hypothetical protein SAMN04488522_105417 [Pedobacter caeni]|uniref:Uncharacterized protein n=2 Tax=Pedobacter caeni TaxID=288992 RepID=A0A1M5JLS5_9SPHI|nr:hypothetical protein SAMN04488522_105417 [Pedobacter caeni]